MFLCTERGFNVCVCVCVCVFAFWILPRSSIVYGSVYIVKWLIVLCHFFAECLEEIGCLMERHTVNVCQPSVPKAISNLASHISDRDNSVRSAALNSLVTAYVQLGESVFFKHVGSVSCLVHPFHSTLPCLHTCTLRRLGLMVDTPCIGSTAYCSTYLYWVHVVASKHQNRTLAWRCPFPLCVCGIIMDVLSVL